MSQIIFSGVQEILLAKADVIIEADANTTYLGFSNGSNPATSTATWAVCKIEKTGSSYPYTTTIKWADATFNKTSILDNYASLTYKFKNFIV